MAIIDLRDDPLRNAQLLSQIGSGIGGVAEGLTGQEQLLKRATQDAIRENPLMLARTYRRMEGNEEGRQQLAGLLDMEPEALDQAMEGISILMPETFEEDLDTTRVEEDVAGEQARAEGAGFELEAERAGAFLERGLPTLEALNQEVKFLFENEDIEVRREAIEKSQEAMATLPPDERERFYYSVARPQFLRDMQFREGMEFEEKIADIRAGAASTDSMMELEADHMSLKSAYLEEFKSLEDQLREVEEEGARTGEIEAIITRYNELANDWARVFPDDSITIIDPLEALFGSEIKGVGRLRTLAPIDLRATVAAMRIASGNGTLDELQATLEENMEPAEAQQIHDLVVERLGEMEQQAQKTKPERMLEWATKGPTTPSRAGAQPSDLGDFGPPGGIPR